MAAERRTKAELVAELEALRARAVDGVSGGLAEAILRSTPDHVYMYARDMRYLYASAAGLRALGLEADAVIGKTWRELGFPPEFMQRLEREVRSVFSTGAEISGDTEFPIPAGVGYYQYVLAPVRDEAGAIIAVASSVRDVTEMSRLRRALDAISASVRASTGEAFFRDLTVRMTEVLAVRYALIVEFVDGDRTRLRAVAAAERGIPAPGVAYELAGTPCENVVAGVTCSYPSGVQALFPEDRLLRDMEAEGYVGTPLVGPSGSVVGLLAALHDAPITHTSNVKTVIELFAVRAGAELERRNIMTSLTRTRSLMVSAEQVGRLGSFVWDIGANAVEWSPGLYTLYGVDPATAPPITFEFAMSFVHADDVPLIERQVRDALAGRGRVELSYRIRRPDGTLRTLWGQSVVERDASGSPASLVGTVHDWSDRAEAEAALRASEERYRSLVENASFGIYQSTLSGRFVSVNEAFVKMLGYDSPEELLGADLANEVYADPAERVRLVNLYPAAGAIVPLDVRWRRKDGAVITVHLSGSRAAVSDGTDGFVMTAEDVTTQRLLEGNLRQSQKMEGIGRMAGGIAHDFNNILTAITSYAELLMDAMPPGAEHHDDVEEIRRAADRAAALTRQLLAFSRQQVLEPHVLDINVVVARIDQMLRRIIGEDIALTTALRATNRVRADPAQLEQVIMNLVVNSRDAVRSGGQIAVTTDDRIVPDTGKTGASAVGPGAYVMLTVADNGTGMDEATLAQAFDPFFTTKSAGAGTGLGLSTVYGVVKQSGGYVFATSIAGVGTSVEVYLPAVLASADWPPVPARVEGSPARNQTVLLVEDDAGVRRAARLALQREGYAVLETGTPEEAAQLARDNARSIVLLLTDVVMPGLSGRQVCDQVRAVIPDLRVLYMSGYPGDLGVRGQSLDPGAPFLSKPFTSASLVGAVKAVLDTPRHSPGAQ